jgi:hypothetical protein
MAHTPQFRMWAHSFVRGDHGGRTWPRRPMRKTPVWRASWATTWESSRKGYWLRANVPRSAFMNRASLPLRMSRRIEEYNVCDGVLPPGLVQ